MRIFNTPYHFYNLILKQDQNYHAKLREEAS
jgi:hypothetical protein